MHRQTSAFILGYHGCVAEVAERLLAGEGFQPSQNDYDWLGHGVYFWEANPERGVEFARESATRKPSRAGTTPAVIGAVIDLGICLDLTTLSGIREVKFGYDAYAATLRNSGVANLPKNSEDRLRRNLDCAVINLLHDIRVSLGEPFDSVKGVFLEGNPIYPGAYFFEKTHIQICVRNKRCIKGVFRVRGDGS